MPIGPSALLALMSGRGLCITSYTSTLEVLSDAIKILEDNVSSETTKESTVEDDKVPSETTNKSLVEKGGRLKKLIQEKAAKGQYLSMALYLDKKSQLAANTGNMSIVSKLLDDAIKALEDSPLTKVIELPVFSKEISKDGDKEKTEREDGHYKKI